MPEHSKTLTDSLLAERRALCATEGVTLNGERARIIGARDTFAWVVQLKTGLQAEYSWESVKRVLSKNKAFRA